MPKLDTSTKAIIAQRSAAMNKSSHSSPQGRMRPAWRPLNTEGIFLRFKYKAYRKLSGSSTAYRYRMPCIRPKTSFWVGL